MQVAKLCLKCNLKLSFEKNFRSLGQKTHFFQVYFSSMLFFKCFKSRLCYCRLMTTVIKKIIISDNNVVNICLYTSESVLYFYVFLYIRIKPIFPYMLLYSSFYYDIPVYMQFFRIKTKMLKCPLVTIIQV